MDELPRDEVRVALCEPEAIDDEATLRRCEALLDDAERARARRFHFERHRKRFVVSHALVRTSLSRHAAVAPASWRFRAEGRGRPEIDAPGGVDLRFNLSHTDGLAACGVVRELDLGVDVEAGSRVRRHVELADRFFSKREARALRALPEGDRPGRFLDTWTLKEAYLKARGQGLALPLDAFTFDLEGEGPLRIAFERDLGDDAAAWQFALGRVGPEHRLAVAVRRGARPDLRVVVERREPAPLPRDGPA